MKAKKLQANGSRGSNAKLTPAQVQEIKNALLAKVTQRSLADKYGVSQPTIADIAHGRTWAHIGNGAKCNRCGSILFKDEKFFCDDCRELKIVQEAIKLIEQPIQENGARNCKICNSPANVVSDRMVHCLNIHCNYLVFREERDALAVWNSRYFLKEDSE